MARAKPRYLVGTKTSTGNSSLDIASGNIEGVSSVNKFGVATDGIQTTATDIWDRADSSATQQIWTAPTQSRIHNIASTSASDTSAGAGARTIRVFGISEWAGTPIREEIWEDITLDGTTNVQTTKSYVIIHRMRCLTWGASGPNVGVITATAVTDATITAQISAGFGQTEMCIYGIPEGQTMYINKWRFSINKSSGQAADAKFYMLWNPIPESVTTGFIIKDISSVQSTGKNADELTYDPPKKFTGPGILKIQAIASSNDLDGDSSFDAVVIND